MIWEDVQATCPATHSSKRRNSSDAVASPPRVRSTSGAAQRQGANTQEPLQLPSPQSKHPSLRLLHANNKGKLRCTNPVASEGAVLGGIVSVSPPHSPANASVGACPHGRDGGVRNCVPSRLPPLDASHAQELLKACSNCGVEQRRPTAQFCWNCGTRI